MPINKLLYFGDFFVIPVAIAGLLAHAFASAGAAATPEVLVALPLGLIAWTFAEYWIHRALYHRAPVLSELHERHHRAPAALIGAPSFLSAAVVLLVAYPPFALAPRFADGFAAGACVGYAAYMFIHHATHHWRIQPEHWLYAARMRHIAHHRDEAAHFGIVTGLWDRVFGTDGFQRDRFPATRKFT